MAFPVPQGVKPNPSLAGLSFDHPPGWFQFERDILEWWSVARESLLLFSIPTNYNDSPLLHFEKEILTWWHTVREKLLPMATASEGSALNVWANDVLHFQYEGELAFWWESVRPITAPVAIYPDVLAFWPMILDGADEGSSLVLDMTGNGHHLSNTGGVTYGAGPGTYAVMDGVEWLFREAQASLDLLVPMTCGCWFWLADDVLNVNPALIAKFDDDSSRYNYLLNGGTPGSVNPFFQMDLISGVTVRTIVAVHTSAIAAEAWHHVVGRASVSGVNHVAEVFLDGVKVVGTSQLVTFQSITNEQPLVVGAAHPDVGDNRLRGRMTNGFLAAEAMADEDIEKMWAIQKGYFGL